MATGCGQSVADRGTASTSANSQTSSADDGSNSVPVSSTVPDSAPSSSTTLSPSDLDPDRLAPPVSPVEMASALTEAETAVRREGLPSDTLDGWGRRQQALYRQLALEETWFDDVLRNVDPSVADAIALNWEARRNLAALLASEEEHHTVPAWHVVAPESADELLEFYKRAEAETGIPWEFVAAINLVETRMGRIQGVSTAGAVGPMQFLPTTWAECCQGDPTNPEDAIIGAATYLTVRGGPEDMTKALWGYNNSDYYVNAVTAYANVMMEDERAYFGYHAWEIYFHTTEGVIRLPVGYEEPLEVDAAEWLVDHPELLLD